MSKSVSKAPVITLIEEAKMGAAIEANKKAHGKVDLQWQVLACSAIAAFMKNDCGNVFYINKVYTALGKGARHKAMAEFFLTFGGVVANTGENKGETPFVKDRGTEEVSAKKANMEGALANMWFDMAASPAPDMVVDYLALILKVAKKSPKEGQTVKGVKFREAVLKLAQEMAEAETGEPAGDHTEG